MNKTDKDLQGAICFAASSIFFCIAFAYMAYCLLMEQGILSKLVAGLAAFAGLLGTIVFGYTAHKFYEWSKKT